MEVQVREVCPVCAGTGKVESEFWTALRKREQAYSEKHGVEGWDLEVVKTSWLHEAGYVNYSDPKLPPEHVDCPHCEHGYVKRWVDPSQWTLRIASGPSFSATT